MYDNQQASLAVLHQAKVYKSVSKLEASNHIWLQSKTLIYNKSYLMSLFIVTEN